MTKTIFNSIIVLGATATGKTKLAVQLAGKLDGEIISADSRQVFRGMDIGTGKDLNEYQNEGNSIPYHLINVVEPGEKYHVDLFKNGCYFAFSEIIKKNKLPIICGGTGMYIHSLLMHQPYTAVPVNEVLRHNLMPLEREELEVKLFDVRGDELNDADLSSKKRLIRAIEIAEFLKYNELPEINIPNFKPIIFGLKNDVDKTRASIKARLEKRLTDGLIDEVEQLLAKGISHETLASYGMEYKFVSKFLIGKLNIQELRTTLYTAICQFAKRQNTFFRKMEKDGVHIHWLDAALPTNELRDLAINNSYHTEIINQSID